MIGCIKVRNNFIAQLPVEFGVLGCLKNYGKENNGIMQLAAIGYENLAAEKL